MSARPSRSKAKARGMHVGCPPTLMSRRAPLHGISPARTRLSHGRLARTSPRSAALGRVLAPIRSHCGMLPRRAPVVFDMGTSASFMGPICRSRKASSGLLPERGGGRSKGSRHRDPYSWQARKHCSVRGYNASSARLHRPGFGRGSPARALAPDKGQTATPSRAGNPIC